MSDNPQQPSNTQPAGQSDNAAPADARAQAAPAPPAARPLRGMASMRGAASLRGGLGRGASVSSSASMVPSRSSYASPAPGGAAGSAGPGSGVRMQFRPVMPQRRKASASPAPTSSAAAESSTASPLATPGSTGGSTRGGGRGRGRGGARPPRQPTQMTASGPFALGPSARPTGKKVAPIGPGGSSLTPAPGSDSQRSSTTPKPDPDRASYRNPDKLKDAEQYSDPEDGGVEIVDMDEVHILDELAPRALPRVAEKASKKDKQKAADARQKKMDNRLAKDERDAGAVRVKSEDDETMPDLQPGASSSLHTSGASTAISSASVSPQPEEEEERGKTADALDLSESEGEELMDDLVDDFVFHDDDDASPENRLYLFQFPQLFPKFKTPKKSDIAAADAAAAPEASEGQESSSSKRRSVSFAEGTTGGAGKARPTSVKDEVAPSSEIDDDSDAADSEEDDKKRDTKRGGRSSSKEGLVGKLNVYRDGRVFLHFGELVMEVTGGSQSTFLQQVMLLDPSNRTATALGELHRKFIVSPELDCMLNDINLYDQEQLVEQQRIKKEQEDKEEADRLKYGASAASFNAIGR
ncbi:uncharacterized protein PAN0_014d5003 [Moesziomyces antarcticus]|uniref:Related to RPC53 - 47 kD subunit of DNA-directed RNA polymerase III n=2 Tax=Pseudozyma antarctica TaxID=84753 RepID=A0A5C3FTQ3_PSEA2|nr:uncharacterized protein PAN0_014d5003 [Moesziomyces antarcticus]GAK66779.1 conserved hypothetical protein [Moesziomyces antarcticus]SPO47828.1 related to RPC53 - 47 kD subunit of DNA-directed RNA polymerase III [Moesziomyces antarcticus]